jgi:hypothetical protein
MFDVGDPLLLLGCVVALGILLFLLRGRFSAESRERRRREKSHRPVVSRKRGPTVKLAADVDKPKRDRCR